MTRQEKYDKIIETLKADGAMIVATHTKATQYGQKHLSMFRLTADGLYVQRGKHWDCIDGCALRFGHRA